MNTSRTSTTPTQPESREPPPSYEDALQLPGRHVASAAESENTDQHARASPTHSRVRRQPSSIVERNRRLSTDESDDETDDNPAESMDYALRADGYETYSMDAETFEPYDDENGDAEHGNVGDDRGVVSDSEGTATNAVLTEKQSTVSASPRRRSMRETTTPPPLSIEPAAAHQYDEQTYLIVSKLRTLNRQLMAKNELQAKQLEKLQDEKKLQIARIEVLEHDVRMVKQTLKNVLAANPGPVDRMVIKREDQDKTQTGSCEPIDKDQPPSYATLGSPEQPPAFSRIVLPRVAASAVRSPRQLGASPNPNRPTTTTCVPSPRKSDGSPRSPVPTPPSTTSGRRALHIAPSSSTATTFLPSGMTTTAKLEKLEQDKRDLISRHAHQLSNYSHELSRLERQVENAQKLVQAKDYELRLQKSRHLYVGCSGGSSSGDSAPSAGGIPSKDNSQRHHHHSTLLSDQLWRELMPSTPPASTLLALPFTSNVGLAFEQLLDHKLMSFHDRMVDATTRDWLYEIRRCGFQVLNLHHSFQCMSQTFKKLAECCHIYELAEAFTKEVQQLTKAEQAFLYVMDPAENEFWCRVPRPGDTDSKDMIMARSRVMPVAGTGGVSAVAAEHTGTTAQNTALLAAAATSGGAHVPCGLASWVFHTKKPLLIPAGHVSKNPHFSTAPDSTDRFMQFKSASTLLMPILHGSTTLGVIQVCGKLTQVAALGISISLEKCEAFTSEDQVVLTLMSHFLSGILPKAAYFTEVESNKVNEETLIQLAPEIFTCLRFEELGKIIIQSAKEILDADRCSLFVADNDDRMLFNWQSDINGKGGVEVVNDVKKSTMRIPFGHGMVGMVAETRQVVNIPDAYEDPRFNSSWDKKTNYRTKSILTVPILATPSAKGKAPVRRQRSKHDVYGAVTMERTTKALEVEETELERQSKQQLLGVVQVINKSGGAPFRAKDEFLLQTISKLIALAIENSQLFQKTQELCASLGKLIADADLAEAVATLSACAEDIIGVESAAIYLLSTDHGSQELITFHRKRHHKVVIKEHMYRHSLLEKALHTRELVIDNEISSSTHQYNAYVDSIGGITARNVLFMPLLVDDPEDVTQSSKKLIGVLHLVNTRGRKLKFDRFDLFLSIVSSQTCSVVASILEKQAMLRQQDQTKHLLDTTLSFFKEMSPVGIINAVYNTCSSLFRVDKAHLFLWEPDHRAMWTAKLSPNAETVNAALVSSSTEVTPTGAGSSSSAVSSIASISSRFASASGHAPSLRSQARRISVLTDQKVRVPTTEGLLEHVLNKSGVVVVKQWVDVAGASGEGDDDNEISPIGGLKPSGSHQSIEGSKYVLRARRSDFRAGFTKHSVVACPVWDIYGLEIVGALVLLFGTGKAPSPAELGNLPNLSRQISGALNVCGDLRAITQRSQKLQGIAEGYTPNQPAPAMSFMLSARGQLVTFSQPLNLSSPSFSAQALLQYGRATAKANGASTSSSFATLDLSKLPLDDDGHRWVFTVSGASLQEMTSEHYVSWIGKDVAGVIATSAVYDKLQTDLQSVYARRETVQGVLSLPGSPTQPKLADSCVESLPKAVVFQLRMLLWEFADEQLWKVDVRRACKLFDGVDPARTRLVSRQHVEFALTTNGRRLELTQVEWDLVHTAFADPETELVDVGLMFRSLAPKFKVWPRVAYEITPILDAMTQSVINVHVLFTASTKDA